MFPLPVPKAPALCAGKTPAGRARIRASRDGRRKISDFLTQTHGAVNGTSARFLFNLKSYIKSKGLPFPFLLPAEPLSQGLPPPPDVSVVRELPHSRLFSPPQETPPRTPDKHRRGRAYAGTGGFVPGAHRRAGAGRRSRRSSVCPEAQNARRGPRPRGGCLPAEGCP